MGINNDEESTNILISEDLPLVKRVTEVKKRISEWTGTLEKTFDHETDEVRLNRYGKKGDKYFFQYIIAREVNTMKRNL